jgi:hypothetical protein
MYLQDYAKQTVLSMAKTQFDGQQWKSMGEQISSWLG